MNASRKTKIIAQGIALFATVMDEPVGTMSSHTIAWMHWKNSWPDLVPIVEKEQKELFDRIMSM